MMDITWDSSGRTRRASAWRSSPPRPGTVPALPSPTEPPPCTWHHAHSPADSGQRESRGAYPVGSNEAHRLVRRLKNADKQKYKNRKTEIRNTYLLWKTDGPFYNSLFDITPVIANTIGIHFNDEVN